MTVTLKIEPKVFVNPQGEAIEYNECTAVIGGNTIYFAPKSSDKKLFNFLVFQLHSQTKESK